MRVLLIFCHPRADSFNAAVRQQALQALQAGGHTVDECDLYAEGFNPVLGADELATYAQIPANRAPVQGYVDRVMHAEALVFVFPVWNFGLPAMLKGWFDRVLLPGVSFDMSNPKRMQPGLTHLRHVVALTTYGTARWRAWYLGDAPRAIMQRFMRRLTDGRARIEYLPLHGMNTATAATRQAFLQRVAAAMRRIG